MLNEYKCSIKYAYITTNCYSFSFKNHPAFFHILAWTVSRTATNCIVYLFGNNNYLDGHITEDVYDCLGFMKYTNYTGKVVPKPNQTTNEMRHWSKKP